MKKNCKDFPPLFVLALKPLIPAQCRVPLGSNKVSGTTLGWEQGKVRGQVGGWLYIACGRTGGLGSDETRVGRAGRAGSDGGSDWRGTRLDCRGTGSDWRGELGRIEGNGVGLGGNGVRLGGNGVGLGGTRSDWGGTG